MVILFCRILIFYQDPPCEVHTCSQSRLCSGQSWTDGPGRPAKIVIWGKELYIVRWSKYKISIFNTSTLSSYLIYFQDLAVNKFLSLIISEICNNLNITSALLHSANMVNSSFNCKKKIPNFMEQKFSISQNIYQKHFVILTFDFDVHIWARNNILYLSIIYCYCYSIPCK